MALYHEIMQHPSYKDKFIRFQRGLHAISESMYEMAKNAAESYTYWNVAYHLLNKEHMELLMDLRKQSKRRQKKLKLAKRKTEKCRKLEVEQSS